MRARLVRARLNEPKMDEEGAIHYDIAARLADDPSQIIMFRSYEDDDEEWIEVLVRY